MGGEPEPIGEILERLHSGGAENAWKAFLKTYSPLIMQVACQYEGDKDPADDCFLFVCGKLCDNGFRRLLQFDPDRGVRFRTWLSSVVSNLCIDWYRREFGRSRPYRAIAALPVFDQLVYHYKFESGLALEACFRALRPTFPGLQRNQLAETISRLHTMLSPSQRWQLSIRRRETTSIAADQSTAGNQGHAELVDPGPGPDVIVQLQQDRAALSRAMSRLTHQQRLLLRLRYEEDLSLREVARLAGLNDAFQARYRIESALATLGDLLAHETPDT